MITYSSECFRVYLFVSWKPYHGYTLSHCLYINKSFKTIILKSSTVKVNLYEKISLVYGVFFNLINAFKYP